jgi:hypothetical protein
LRIEWHITDDDVDRVKDLLRRQHNNAFVRRRIAWNLAETKPSVEREQFWFHMVGMRLTSAQRSGPASHVARFINTHPFPLRYGEIRIAEDVKSIIVRVLKASGGIRFVSRIAEELASNLQQLEQGEWARALQQCNQLTRPVALATEREVADYIDDTFEGFGPKQSRNLLQALGLTRYEIPIDSRVTDWLNEFGFPVRLSARGLADRNYYNFVSEGIQALCAASGVFPCILDAAVFALRDGDGWNEASVVY